MKINHGRRSLFLVECLQQLPDISLETMWMIRLKEQIIHESHGDDSPLYFTHVKALLMSVLQSLQQPYVGYAQFRHLHLEQPTDPAASDPLPETFDGEDKLGSAYQHMADPTDVACYKRLEGLEVNEKESGNLPEGSKCSECGSCEIGTISIQLRSADEAETVFCQCRKCSKRWRMKQT